MWDSFTLPLVFSLVLSFLSSSLSLLFHLSAIPHYSSSSLLLSPSFFLFYISWCPVSSCHLLSLFLSLLSPLLTPPLHHPVLSSRLLSSVLVVIHHLSSNLLFFLMPIIVSSHLMLYFLSVHFSSFLSSSLLFFCSVRLYVYVLVWHTSITLPIHRAKGQDISPSVS